jgi:hypothetical protein
VTFGFPRRRPSAKGLGILALVVVVLFVLVGLLGKAGSGSSGGSGGAAAPPATGPGPTRGPQGPEQAGEWTFDEGAGRAAADTAGGHPLSLLTGASWDPAGKDATAVRFDGSRGYGETRRPVLDSAGSYSVAAWVRLDRVPDGFATAVSQDGGRDSAFALQYVPSGHWAMSGLAGRALSEDPPVRGTWTHLAGVRDATTGQWVLYVDGVRQVQPPPGSSPGPSGSGSPGSGSPGSGSAGSDAPGSDAAGSDTPGSDAPAPGSGSGSAGSGPAGSGPAGSGSTASAPVVDGPLAIGRGRSSGRATAFFPGAVDSVHVYAGALRDEDVQALYQSGR